MRIWCNGCTLDYQFKSLGSNPDVRSNKKNFNILGGGAEVARKAHNGKIIFPKIIEIL